MIKKHFPNRISVVVCLSVVLFFTNTNLASAALGLGDICTNNKNNCASGSCQESNYFIDGTATAIWYCDCVVGTGNVDCNIYGPKENYGKWTCIKSSGNVTDHKLNYCKLASGDPVYPLVAKYQPTPSYQPKPDITLKPDISILGISLVDEIKLSKPELEIRLPQTNFSDIQNTITEEYDGTYIHIPWIGQYIKAIYNWGMVVASIIAVVMIILQAARIITSANGEAKMDAYKKIARVAIGLIIIWSSYFILYTINPALVEFKSLKIKYMAPEEVAPDAN